MIGNQAELEKKMRKGKRRVLSITEGRDGLNDRLDDILAGSSTNGGFVAEKVMQETKAPDHPHLLETPARALAFMMAGNATVTLKSRKTGTRFTYRIRASEDGKVHFVALLRGENNESDYSYFGYVRRGVFCHGGQKAKVERDAPSVRAFAWSFKQLQGHELPDSLEIWHEGRCGRCGRKLTVPESIASGIGPDCAEQMGTM
jgi:hypothetical protein